MLKHLLVTTALVTLMSTAALAESSTTTTQGNNTNATMTQGTVAQSGKSARYLTATEAKGHMASKLIGMNIYSGQADSGEGAATQGTATQQQGSTQGTTTQDTASQDTTTQGTATQGSSTQANASRTGESIGEINDIIIGDDGRVLAVIVGVGGFLGMGEKDVAIAFEDLQWNNNGNQPMVVTLMTSKESLKGAPAFDTNAADMANVSNDTETTGAATSTNNNTAANTTTDTMNNSSSGNSASNAGGTNNNATVGAAPDRQNLSPAKNEMLSAENLNNRTVYSKDNQNIGEVADVLLKDGKIAAVVLDVGGFLGMGEKPVAISFNDLEVMSDNSDNLYLYTKFTREQLDSAPTYDQDAYSKNPDSVTLRSGS
jgi:uncharacterized protein YrrD